MVAGPFGPQQPVRCVVVTTDPLTLPDLTTWYLITNLPAPDSQRALTSPLAAAPLPEVVRLYSLREWVEQSYKQVKHTLGWAQYQVRSDTAIRRHWTLVCCAFTFCWWQAAVNQLLQQPDALPNQPTSPQPQKKCHAHPIVAFDVAPGATPGQSLARPLHHAQTLLASLLAFAPAAPVAAAS